MSVYTRTGDKGKTSLYPGKRISKASPRIETIGSLDEANSAIGTALVELKDKKIKKELIEVQNNLFEIGAALANPSQKIKSFAGRVKEFEQLIDELTRKLPELNNFILPGGSKSGSYLHLARTIVRRAERRVTELSEKEKVDEEIIIYINRLSDFLFMIARFVNYKEKKKEVYWKSR